MGVPASVSSESSADTETVDATAPDGKAMHALLIGGVDVLVPSGTTLRFAWPETKPEDLIAIKVKGVTFEVDRAVLQRDQACYLSAITRFHPEEREIAIEDVEPRYFPVVLAYLRDKHNETDPMLKCFPMAPEDSRGIDKLCEWLLPRPQPLEPGTIPSLIPGDPSMFHYVEGDDLLVLVKTSYGCEWPDQAAIDPVLVKAYNDNKLNDLNAHLIREYGIIHTVGTLKEISLDRIPRGQPFKISSYDGSCYVTRMQECTWLIP